MRPSRGLHDEHSEARGAWVRREGAVMCDAADVPRFLEFSAMSEFHALSRTLEVATGGRRK